MTTEIKPIGNDTEENRMLNKYLVSSICSGFVEIGKDKVVLPNNFNEDMAKYIENFEVRNEDVFFICHPKTGSTWFQELVWLINNDYDYDKIAALGNERFVLLEMKAIAKPDLAPGRSIEKQVLNRYFKLEDRPNVRYIKSHLHWSLLPKQIQDGTKTPKMFCVLRNPQDVCVSFYHFTRMAFKYTGTFEEFCQLFMAGKLIWGPYWKQVLSHWEQKHRSNLFFVHYREMKEDFPAVVRRVAKFLNKPISDERVEEVTNYLKFENMKSNKFINRETTVENVYKKLDLVVETTPFVRAGEEGGYKAVMSPEMIKKFNEWCKQHFEGTGLQF